MRRFLSIGLLVALMGAGCATAPSPTPAQMPVPNATTEPVSPTAVVPTTVPATVKPTTTPTPKPVSKPTVKTIVVEMKDNVFSPQIIAINAGDTVVWKNVGNNGHTVRSSGVLTWDSGNITSGGTFSHTFPSDGRYNYLCANHAGMTGTVIVGTIRP